MIFQFQSPINEKETTSTSLIIIYYNNALFLDHITIPNLKT